MSPPFTTIGTPATPQKAQRPASGTSRRSPTGPGRAGTSRLTPTHTSTTGTSTRSRMTVAADARSTASFDRPATRQLSHRALTGWPTTPTATDWHHTSTSRLLFFFGGGRCVLCRGPNGAAQTQTYRHYHCLALTDPFPGCCHPPARQCLCVGGGTSLSPKPLSPRFFFLALLSPLSPSLSPSLHREVNFN